MGRFFLILLISFACTPTYSQQVPIGQWQSHFAVSSMQTIENVQGEIWTGSRQLLRYQAADDVFTQYTKVNGLSDINITLLRYDPVSNYLLVVYENSNIDLWQNNRSVNMPDIKNRNSTGSKKINQVLFHQGLMYLATDFGIVVINPAKREIKETYTLEKAGTVLSVKGLALLGDSLMAATNNGIYRAWINDPILQDMSRWQPMLGNNTLNAEHAFTLNNALYVATSNMVYRYANGNLNAVYASNRSIRRIRTGQTRFYVCEGNDLGRAVKVIAPDGVVLDSNTTVNPYDVVEVGNDYWVADYWQGMTRVQGGQSGIFRPNAVYDNSCYNLSIYNNKLYVAAGGERSWIYTFNTGGFSEYNNGTWTWYNRFANIPAMDTLTDITDIAVDPRNGNLYAASFRSGLLEIQPDKTCTVYKNNGYVQATIGDPNAYRLVNLKFDRQNNLWMSNYNATEQLVVKKADGSWQKFGFPYSGGERSASQIEIDDAGQKWVLAPRGIGVFVFNDNNSIDNPNDDKVRKLTTGAGYGNLPSNDVYSIAKDKNGKIWVGTGDGIAIFHCPESIFSSGGCDAELKIVQYDLNAGLLFQREMVKTIAVDGANNKWIGTNNGVWLISDDGEKIIHRFNTENSPLPSNEINKIVVHPTTGDVFIATNAGLMSYRAEATEGAKTQNNIRVFPNPVSPNYNGQIAIEGLTENADVRITDVAGRLVYRCIATGGRAVWNGKTYLGEKPHSGVYYIFATNNDGTKSNSVQFVIEE
ncbi:MAG: two-component regulator propeller domain-containing protein [Chitinophagaceae bacterium]